MITRSIDYFRRYLRRRHVRPWALLPPIVVLFISLPLLRPLRHPDPRAISDDELSRLATVQAMVERHSLAIEKTNFAFIRAKIERGRHWYSDQPPTMAALLYGPYWTIRQLGLTFRENPDWVMYLLTVIGVTLPVAAAGGLVYRMGRLFELPRPWRAALALAVVLATGLISYATVLNAHAPAAALVLASAACLIHITIARRGPYGILWIAVAGFCAALAAAIDPPAGVFLLLFIPVVLALRVPVRLRIAGLLLYVLGAVGPLALHTALTVPVTGDLRPGMFHPELRFIRDEVPADDPGRLIDDDETASVWRSVGHSLSRLIGAFIGGHGLFSHFPILIVGILGVSMVMHRHWPITTKLLASVTIAGGLLIILAYAICRVDWRYAMFGSRWFIVFLPLTLFWAGAWLRRSHRPASWIVVAVFLAFSVTVSLLGATGPMPRGGFSHYTVAGSIRNLLTPPQPDSDALLAGRLAGVNPSP